ncbi:MAG: serine/threonine-protein kinase [Myxococcota bacterium]
MAEDSETDELVGRTLADNYRLDSLLGEGGMGAVYAATQLNLNRKVAVKVLHPHLGARKELLERFRREALTAAALGHSNIVQVTDFQHPKGEPAFLVMELLRGHSLADVIDNGGPMAPPRAAFIGCQILSALEAAHEAGIIHRDLKPENVFLTSVAGVTDVVKLLDFGIAKLSGDDEDTRLTKTGLVVGSPCFMSPEQARAEEITPRTDVYGIGMVLYNALTGQLPFTAGGYTAMIVAVLEQTAASVDSIRGDVPPGFVHLVHRAIAKNPAERFATAAEMRAALEPFAAQPTGMGIQTHGIGPLAGAPGSAHALSPGVSTPGASSPGIASVGASPTPYPGAPGTPAPAVTPPPVVSSPGLSTATGAPVETAATRPKRGTVGTVVIAGLVGFLLVLGAGVAILFATKDNPEPLAAAGGQGQAAITPDLPGEETQPGEPATEPEETAPEETAPDGTEPGEDSLPSGVDPSAVDTAEEPDEEPTEERPRRPRPRDRTRPTLAAMVPSMTIPESPMETPMNVEPSPMQTPDPPVTMVRIIEGNPAGMLVNPAMVTPMAPARRVSGARIGALDGSSAGYTPQVAYGTTGRALPTVSQCFARTQAGERATYVLSVGANGAVIVASPSNGSPSLHPCITPALRRLVFPPAPNRQGGRIRVTFLPVR